MRSAAGEAAAAGPGSRQRSYRRARPEPQPRRPLSDRSFRADLDQRQLQLEPGIEAAAALDCLVQLRHAHDGAGKLGLAERARLAAEALRLVRRLEAELLLHVLVRTTGLEHQQRLPHAPDVVREDG